MPVSADTLICNTGPLIALAKIGKIALLTGLFKRVLVPCAVWVELTQARRVPEANAVDLEVLGLEIITDLLPVEPLLIAQLDPGEAAVLTLARQTPGGFVLIDERKARHIAELVYNLPLIGTAGLLLRAKRCGLVREIRPLFQQLIAHKYYLSDRVIERICSEAGESVVHEPHASYGPPHGGAPCRPPRDINPGRIVAATRDDAVRF